MLAINEVQCSAILKLFVDTMNSRTKDVNGPEGDFVREDVLNKAYSAKKRVTLDNGVMVLIDNDGKILTMKSVDYQGMKLVLVTNSEVRFHMNASSLVDLRQKLVAVEKITPREILEMKAK